MLGLPNIYVLLGGAAIVALLCAGCGYEGWHQKSLRDQAAIAAAEAKVIDKIEKADTISANVVQAQAIDQLAIKTVTLSVIKEVPVYVTQKSAAACAVPLGLVLLLNSAASGLPAPGLTPGQSYDDPSGVGLDTVTGIVAGNYGKYRGAQSQIGALVDWSRKQAALAAAP